tara:strand:- start:345 stop:728 length:384 start_codon:yes stop_codon:yes gene_type:complete
MRTFGKIKKGKLILNNKDKFNLELKQFEGKDIIIKIEERSPNRSKEQNSLWWKWMDLIGLEIGYTKEETHQLMKYKFLKRSVVNIDGYEETIIKGTSTLTHKEFSALMNNVHFFANDTLNINLPSNE